jgi:molybdate transport system permease protein
VDWTAFSLSLRLAGWTCAVLLPLGILAGRRLAWRRFKAKGLVEALIALSLVLPPTVLGYYVLVTLGSASPVGRAWQTMTGHQLVFTFGGLLIASVLVNVPFALQPIQRAFEAILGELREAAWSAASHLGLPSSRSSYRWLGPECCQRWHSPSHTPWASSGWC